MMMNEFIHKPRVAYFSMEIALQSEIPTYSGGLGVLAGDTLRSAADLEIPMVAVTLVSRAGYFRQSVDGQGRQSEQPDWWQPQNFASLLEAKVAVTIEQRRVWVGGWLYVLKGHMNTNAQPVLLLDTDFEENFPEDRTITHFLYGDGEDYRLKQEIVLGIGGIRMLQALGFDVRQYHLNEGHSALLTVELLRRYAYSSEDVRPGEPQIDVPRVRDLCIFTTHTPVEAGHDKFSYDLVARIMGEVMDFEILKRFGGEDVLNLTRLALNLSEYINGVAKRHAEVSRKMFPGYHVHAVTNGAHPFQWASVPFKALYNRHLPGWCHQPELLMRAECCLSDEEVWEAHLEAKQVLIDKVKDCCGLELSLDLPIFGFARRMTAYKRPDLLFSDMDRLKEIAQAQPFQIIFAGKAHPKDEEGKQLIEHLYRHIQELSDVIPMVFLPDYGMALASILVSGCDVWLNTPLPPLEASGTSGMKAAFNGVPSLSVLDGWWIEGCIEGVTGWAIGKDNPSTEGADAVALYDKLEKVVLPLYNQNRAGWISVMKQAISKNASYFNSHRMMRRYASEAYLR